MGRNFGSYTIVEMKVQQLMSLNINTAESKKTFSVSSVRMRRQDSLQVHHRFGEY